VTPRAAIALVRRHGIMLESARGSAPSFASAVVGEEVPGAWWGHPQSHEIYRATRAVRESGEVLVCRLLGGKVTYVHRRLWPALVRLASRFDAPTLAWIEEVHTTAGTHRAETTPFPAWVPDDVAAAGGNMIEEKALRMMSGSGGAVTHS
jgi:hypothetical protein